MPLQNVARALRNAVAPTSNSAEADTANAEFEHARELAEQAVLLLNDLRQKHTSAHARLKSAETVLAQAALDAETSGDVDCYDRLAAKVDRERADVARLQKAITAAATQKHEAEHKLHRLGVEGTVKVVKRQGNTLVKKAERLDEAVAGLAEAFEDYCSAADKLKFSWPMPGGIVPGNHGLGHEITRWIGEAFYKHLPRHVADKRYRPALPGTASGLNLGDPKTMPTLKQRASECVANLVRIVEAGPVNVDAPLAPVNAAALTRAEEAAQAEPVSRSAEKISSDQIMAAQPQSKRIVLDLRKQPKE